MMKKTILNNHRSKPCVCVYSKAYRVYNKKEPFVYLSLFERNPHVSQQKHEEAMRMSWKGLKVGPERLVG